MAKKIEYFKEEVKEEIKEEVKKVIFLREFHGNLNSYKLDVPKTEIGKVKELPILIYDWVQKFKACKDA
jgi:hypothetical protein